jgi:hypothetical protein
MRCAARPATPRREERRRARSGRPPSSVAARSKQVVEVGRSAASPRASRTHSRARRRPAPLASRDSPKPIERFERGLDRVGDQALLARAHAIDVTRDVDRIALRASRSAVGNRSGRQRQILCGATSPCERDLERGGVAFQGTDAPRACRCEPQHHASKVAQPREAFGRYADCIPPDSKCVPEETATAAATASANSSRATRNCARDQGSGSASPLLYAGA